MDFSAAWADYYRKQGLHAQAQQVLNQVQHNQGAPNPGQSAQNPGQQQIAQAPVDAGQMQAQSPQ